MSVASSKYLILGNSAAAVNAIESIRALDQAGTITLLARETEHAYSRPLITYRLGGKVDDAGMDYRRRDFYTAHNVDARLGVEAVKVDPVAKVVTCRDGSKLGFENLLIATGGAPIRPPIEGSDAAGVFTFTTWADQRAVDEFIAAGKAARGAVVLGGGLIGLKSVEALVARGVQTTIVELADRVLAITFDQQASDLAEQSLADKGVGIRTNSTIKKVLSRNGAVESVVLADGASIDCGLVILAIGVRPDLSLVAGTSIKTDRGILVDDRLATNVPGIFAAGDVAQGLDVLAGQQRAIPILPVAARQGRIAGNNMAGGQLRYGGGVAMNAVDVLGLPTISVGQTVEAAGDEVLARLDRKGRTYRKLVIRNNKLIGAIFIGRIDRAGLFTGMIRTGLDVSTFKNLLLDDEFGLLSLPADYRAHMVSGAGIEV
jgi:NAD(P)H-nitrite reductase large subunit